MSFVVALYSQSPGTSMESAHYNILTKKKRNPKQVAQWATIPYLGASIMFGETIIDDAQRQVTLNLKQ